MRKVICCIAASAAVVLGSASPAFAGQLDVRFKWRHCENAAAGLGFRTTFFRPAASYNSGPGRYMIKSQIRWDKHTSAGWRQSSVDTNQSDWIQINSPAYNPTLLHGDRTDWGYRLFRGRWRAHVIVKLIKNRPGPKDNRVDIVERFFEKPMFHERGSYCEGGTFRR